MPRTNRYRKTETGGEEADTLDAYVAMGGDEDGGGNVDADKLIDVIKNEFAMTIDIEGLIKEIDAVSFFPLDQNRMDLERLSLMSLRLCSRTMAGIVK